MKMSKSRSIFAAIAIVGIANSVPGSVHTAFAAANGIATAAIGKIGGPDISTKMPSAPNDERVLGTENFEAPASLDGVAERHRARVKYAEAEPRHGRTIVSPEKARDPVHPKLDLAFGGRLYEANCAACHGVSLEGEPNWRRPKPDGLLPAPPLDADGHAWFHSDEQLFSIVKEGDAAGTGIGCRSARMGFGEMLSDGEIRAVLTYIKFRWPENLRRRQAAIGARAGQSD